tara:strand:+ start:8521 stop:8814 length:294 start_codon:yes stop_codon:yes gene_type:complete
MYHFDIETHANSWLIKQTLLYWSGKLTKKEIRDLKNTKECGESVLGMYFKKYLPEDLMMESNDMISFECKKMCDMIGLTIEDEYYEVDYNTMVDVSA